jgi:hypothetical protein
MSTLRDLIGSNPVGVRVQSTQTHRHIVYGLI